MMDILLGAVLMVVLYGAWKLFKAVRPPRLDRNTLPSDWDETQSRGRLKGINNQVLWP